MIDSVLFTEIQFKMSSVTSEEFLWSCELSAANKEYAWAPEVMDFNYYLVFIRCCPQVPVKEEEDLEDDSKPVHK